MIALYERVITEPGSSPRLCLFELPFARLMPSQLLLRPNASCGLHIQYNERVCFRGELGPTHLPTRDTVCRGGETIPIP